METPLSEKLKAVALYMDWVFLPANIYVEFNRFYNEKTEDYTSESGLKYNTDWDWLIPVFSKFMKENKAQLPNEPAFTVWRDFVLFVQNDDIKQAFETMYFAIEYMKREKLPENILKPKEL